MTALQPPRWFPREPATGEELRRLTHPDKVLRPVVTADGRRALASCEDDTLRRWDVDTGTVVAQFPVGETDTGCLSMMPDGR